MLADHYANLGAALDQVPEQDTNIIKWVDNTAYLIQQRLLCTASYSISPHAKQEEKPARVGAGLISNLAELGHEVVAQSSNLEQCINCRLTWRKADRRKVILKGICNPNVWGEPPPMQMDVPWVTPVGSSIFYNGKDIHITHHLAWQTGLLYCLRCGAYSSTRVRRLTQPCRQQPNASARFGLKRIGEGRHPISGVRLVSDLLPPSFIAGGN